MRKTNIEKVKCDFCGKKVELIKMKIIENKNACKKCYDTKRAINKGKKKPSIEEGISFLNEKNKKEFLKEHKR